MAVRKYSSFQKQLFNPNPIIFKQRLGEFRAQQGINLAILGLKPINVPVLRWQFDTIETVHELGQTDRLPLDFNFLWRLRRRRSPHNERESEERRRQERCTPLPLLEPANWHESQCSIHPSRSSLALTLTLTLT